ncbi:MAG TPA: glycosyltransferase family 39 protein [Humisphaera sp.]
MTATTPQLSPRSLVIVILYAGLLLLTALGGRVRVLTQHEVFAAQPAREMLSGGHWVIPHFAGVPRLVKPPAAGWLIAGSMKLFGTEAEWAVRLPAGLAGVATAALVAVLAGRWLGDAGGLVAGLMQASFFYVLMQARLAEADMPMCAAVALAMLAFARGAVDRPPEARGLGPVRWAVLFHLGLALSFLFKGVGGGFVLAGCMTWTLVTGRWRAAVGLLVHPAGLAVLLPLAGAWPALALREQPGLLRIWYREVFARYKGDAFDPSDPWHVYFWVVPLLLLPWLPFAVRGLVEKVKLLRGGGTSAAGALRSLRSHRRATFLLCWFAAGMTILTFSAARHKHYAIPMLPPLTLLAAAGFLGWVRESRADADRGRRTGAIVAVAVLAVGLPGAAVAGLRLAKAPAGTAAAIVAVAVGVAAVAWLHGSGRRRGAAVACFATALVGMLMAQWLVLPAYDDFRASADLARRANAAVPARQTIYLVGLGEAQPAFYLDHPLARADRVKPRPATAQAPAAPSDVERLAATHPATDLYVLCPASTLPDISRWGKVTELDRVDHRRRTEPDAVVLVKLTTPAADGRGPATRTAAAVVAP